MKMVVVLKYQVTYLFNHIGSKPNFAETVYQQQKKKIAEIINNKEKYHKILDTDRDRDLKDRDYINENSTIVVLNEQDIKNYWSMLCLKMNM